MIAVIFEVEISPHGVHSYRDAAPALAPLLKSVPGFISIERFQSLATPNKLLSLSFWRDEEAVRQWRNTPEHRAQQFAGREGIFQDYRLRVAGVIRDYSMQDRQEAPEDSGVIERSNVTL